MIAPAVVSIFIILLWDGPLGEYLEQKVARNLEFQLRAYLGKDPKINPSLKIYSFDDHTLDLINKERFTFNQWVSIIHLIARSEPKAIIIDAIFSTIVDRDENFSNSIDVLNKLTVPVYTGAFVKSDSNRYGSPILSREELRLDNPIYGIFDKLKGSLPQYLNNHKDSQAYGPHPLLAGVFKNVGHILHEGSGVTPAVFKLKDQKILPHLALMLFNDLEVKNGDFYVNSNLIYTNSDGTIPINFLTPQELYSHHRILGTLYKKSLSGSKSNFIRKGDIVLILPEMFTGHTDNTLTPFGIQPGGLVITSLVNSAINGNWIQKIEYRNVFIFIFAYIGTFLAIYFSSFWLISAILVFFIVVFSVETLLFCKFDVMLPWFAPFSSLFFSSLIIFVRKSNLSEAYARSIKTSLEGLMPEQRLKAIMNNPDAVNLEFKEQNISIMFIDVVGFSLMAEVQEAKLIFNELKNLLNTIGDTIKEHGGVVDKSFGDGMLCYFGYKFGSETTMDNHAQVAVECAIRIQLDNLNNIYKSHKENRPIFPLRIGINTAPAFVGNVGTGERIDFTAIGRGVNFAKRLESGSEPLKILMSQSTYLKIDQMFLPGKALTKRFIALKHYSMLQEVYEYDPLYFGPRIRKEIINIFQLYVPNYRFTSRWKVGESKIILSLPQGKKVSVYDFSSSGLAIITEVQFKKDDFISFGLEYLDDVIREKLVEENIASIKGKIRWCALDENQHIYGLMFSDLSQHSCEILERIFFECAFPQNMKNGN